MSDTDLSRLAHAIAQDIYNLADILRQHRVDPVFFNQHIRNHPRFKQLYLEAHTLWNDAGNANERTTLKAGVMVEEWLAEANRLFHDTNQPLSSKVELFKTMGKIAGLEKGKDDRQVAPGERVVVNINLSAAGAPPVTIDKVAPMLDVTPAQP
jgi:hypothetical protein